jgi:hypothetical protein
MPQHVAVDEERKAGGLPRSSNHALVAGHGERRQALGYEHIDCPRPLGRFPLEPTQRPQLLAAQRMHACHAALGAPHMQLAGPKVDIVPAQRHELAGAQAMPVGDEDRRRVPMAPAVVPGGLHQPLNLPLG